jgi:hypothetical protein
MKKHIRTLILRAGKVHDPIRCSLNIVSLVEQALYEALSYTWGDAKHTAPILVDGARLCQSKVFTASIVWLEIVTSMAVCMGRAPEMRRILLYWCKNHI